MGVDPWVVTPKLNLTSLVVHTLRKTHNKYQDELQQAGADNQELLDMLNDDCEDAHVATHALAALQKAIMEDESHLDEINRIFNTTFDLEGFKVLILQKSPSYSLEMSPSDSVNRSSLFDVLDEARKALNRTSSDFHTTPGEPSLTNHNSNNNITEEEMMIN